jgi:hypothetical protein
MIKKKKNDDGELLSRRGFLKISGLAGGAAIIGPMGIDVPGAFGGEIGRASCRERVCLQV